VQGDAESLPFADESFDAVINVEAAHGYPNFPRFLAEVARVLRPGGRFLYADFRSYLDFSQWEAAMADAPMRLLSERVINAEVLRGLDNLAPRYLDLVGHHLPACLRPFGRLFVGAPGSLMYRELQRGRLFVPDVLLRQGLSRLSRTGAPALGGSRDGRRRGALFEL